MTTSGDDSKYLIVYQKPECFPLYSNGSEIINVDPSAPLYTDELSKRRQSCTQRARACSARSLQLHASCRRRLFAAAYRQVSVSLSVIALVANATLMWCVVCHSQRLHTMKPLFFLMTLLELLISITNILFTPMSIFGFGRVLTFNNPIFYIDSKALNLGANILQCG